MTVFKRMGVCATSALAPAMKTGLWMIKITVPVSFGVLLLKLTGLLPVIAGVFAPLFALFGLPGESALVFVTAVLVNIYACIGVIETLGLDGHTITILALMCLISHSLPVETAVQKKTGSSFWAIVMVRLAASFAGAFFLSLFLQPDAQTGMDSATGLQMAAGGYAAEFKVWFVDITILCVKILVLITLLMMLQRILEEFGVMRWLSRMLKYPLLVLGVPREAGFLWIVANTLGLSYGAGIIVDHVEHGRLSGKHADILNYHIAVSHSLLEDTLLFVAVGACAGWILFPRIALAGAVVWIKRIIEAVAANRRRMPAA